MTGREATCTCDPALPHPMVDALCTVHGNRAPEPGREATRSFWPYWRTENDLLELGDRLPPSDEPTAIEHRLAKANGLTYGCPPRHWAWERARHV